MKSARKVERFDYSKYKSWDYEHLKEYEFWGFHPKSGRLHIDTKRYKKACKSVGIMDFLPQELFAQRNTVYYKPANIRRYDYKVNIFKDLFEKLKKDWEEEYKPLLNKITKPEEIEEKYRLESIAYTSSAEDYEEINVAAQIEKCKREYKYRQIIQSLYCQFIQKIAAEVDRFTLIVMSKCGWEGEEFSFKIFKKFSQNLLKHKDKIKLNTLSQYNAYDLLHKFNNYLKHNSIKAYNFLKADYPNNVATIENGKTKKQYENGMYSGDWIIVEANYIDDLLNKLVVFFEDYCKCYLKEDIERSKWDYDEYFYNAKRNMQNPGLYV